MLAKIMSKWQTNDFVVALWQFCKKSNFHLSNLQVFVKEFMCRYDPFIRKVARNRIIFPIALFDDRQSGSGTTSPGELLSVGEQPHEKSDIQKFENYELILMREAKNEDRFTKGVFDEQ